MSAEAETVAEKLIRLLGDPRVDPIYEAAYMSIRHGAPGLSDGMCAAISRSIALKIAYINNRRTTPPLRSNGMNQDTEKVEL